MRDVPELHSCIRSVTVYMSQSNQGRVYTQYNNYQLLHTKGDMLHHAQQAPFVISRYKFLQAKHVFKYIPTHLQIKYS